MLPREKLVLTPEYWVEVFQNNLCEEYTEYMKKEQLTKEELPDRLEISKFDANKILNGTIKCSFTKYIKLSLKIGKVPSIEFLEPRHYLAMCP